LPKVKSQKSKVKKRKEKKRKEKKRKEKKRKEKKRKEIVVAIIVSCFPFYFLVLERKEKKRKEKKNKSANFDKKRFIFGNTVYFVGRDFISEINKNSSKHRS
jgi:hypothetical protein